MKTTKEVSPAPPAPASGATKRIRPQRPSGVIRLANWPDCLKDEDVAASVEGAAFEGYDQKSGKRTGIYRAR